MVPRPDAVFLDLGDTLVRAHPSWASVYLSTFPEFGIEATEEQLEDALRTATRSGAWEFEGPFEATEEGSFQRLMALDRLVFGRLGYHDLPESFFRAIDAAFHRRAAWHVFPDVLPALDAMRAAGLRLGVVSNWGWTAPELLHLLELASNFEVLAISARVGYQKPHPAIFQHALDQLGASPADAIHVGDDPIADVVGARRAGIEPVLIVREHRRASIPDADVRADGAPLIGDFAGLLDLLGVDRPVPA
jgi:putative hydrolase of the HAD superfamily